MIKPTVIGKEIPRWLYEMLRRQDIEVTDTSQQMAALTRGESPSSGGAPLAGSLSHHKLLDLLSGDDHTQYALLRGRVGGQSLFGSLAPSSVLPFSDGPSGGHFIQAQSSSPVSTWSPITIGTSAAINDIIFLVLSTDGRLDLGDNSAVLHTGITDTAGNIWTMLQDEALNDLNARVGRTSIWACVVTNTLTAGVHTLSATFSGTTTNRAIESHRITGFSGASVRVAGRSVGFAVQTVPATAPNTLTIAGLVSGATYIFLRGTGIGDNNTSYTASAGFTAAESAHANSTTSNATPTRNVGSRLEYLIAAVTSETTAPTVNLSGLPASQSVMLAILLTVGTSTGDLLLQSVNTQGASLVHLVDDNILINATQVRFRDLGNSITNSYIRGTDGAFVGPVITASQHLLNTNIFDDVTAGPVARGDLITGQGVTPAWTKLTVGGSSTLLKSNGSDVAWGTVTLLSAFHSDTLTHAPLLGDIIFANATPAWAALAGQITTTRKFLRQTGSGSISAAPAWDTLLAADVPASALTKTDDTNVTLALGGTPASSLLAAVSLTLGWTGTLSVLRGGTAQSSPGHLLQTTLFDDVTAGAAARGDLITGQGASPTWTKLSKGTANQILKSDGTDLSWITPGTDSVLATFDDSVFRIYNHTTPTKLVAFDTSGITAANTRTLVVPDVSATLILSQGTSAGQIIGTGSHTGGSASDLVIEGRVLLGDGLSGINFTAGRILDMRPVATSGATIWNYQPVFTSLSGAASGTITGLQMAFSGTPGYTSGTFGMRGMFFTSTVTVPSGVTCSESLGALFQSSAVITGSGVLSKSTGLRIITLGATPTVGTTPTISGLDIQVNNRAAICTQLSHITFTSNGSVSSALTDYIGIDMGANPLLDSALVVGWTGLRIPDAPANPTGTILGLKVGNIKNYIAGQLRIGSAAAPTHRLEIAAGSTTIAPIKLTSGVSLSSPVAGAIEFTTDDYFATITTGPARKAFVLDDGARLTATKMPVASTNGRLIDSSFYSDGSDNWWVGTGTGVPYAVQYLTNPASFDVTLTNQNQYYELDGTTPWSVGPLNLCTTTDPYITVTLAGTYKIDWTLSFTVNANNQSIEFGIMLDQTTVQTLGTAHVDDAATGQLQEAAGTALITLTAGQKVSLATQNITSAGKIISINHGNLTIVQIGG